jgi:hypothetical protein
MRYVSLGYNALQTRLYCFSRAHHFIARIENTHARLTLIDVARIQSFTTIYTVADVRYLE